MAALGWEIVLERRQIEIDRWERPILVAVVDTEEEFDWNAPFDSSATSVAAMQRIEVGQQAFDEYDVRPCYVVDFPVASSREASAPLCRFLEQGRATVGAHLHPWVSPPIEEDICRRNSFAGNLPRPLESAKLERLSEQLAASFGHRPLVYKAGRYGFGPRTQGILEELGFEVDLSFSPPYDYSAEGGPDYSSMSCRPFWFGADGDLLGIPCCGAYVGIWKVRRHALYTLAKREPLERLRIAGVLSRLGLLERLLLSPEGHTLEEMRRLTRSLLSRGFRVFALSFHSPSLQPGCTPYVRTSEDLRRFLGRLRGYLEFFLRELGGVSMTPLELKEWLSRREGIRQEEGVGRVGPSRPAIVDQD